MSSRFRLYIVSEKEHQVADQLIYENTNAFGTCVGQTLLWCQKAVQFPLEDTKPDEQKALSLQRTFRGSPLSLEENYDAALKDARLVGTRQTFLGTEALDHIEARREGLYAILTKQHAIGVKKNTTGIYLFEPNEGLSLHNTEADFLRELRTDTWLWDQLQSNVELIKIRGLT
jgi:hypothetical protein